MSGAAPVAEDALEARKLRSSTHGGADGLSAAETANPLSRTRRPATVEPEHERSEYNSDFDEHDHGATLNPMHSGARGSDPGYVPDAEMASATRPDVPQPSRISRAWTGAKGLASSAWTGAKGLASSAWTGAKDLASSAWTGAKGRASSAHASFRSTGRKGMQSVIDRLPNPENFTPELDPGASVGTPVHDGARPGEAMRARAAAAPVHDAFAKAGQSVNDKGEQAFSAMNTAEGTALRGAADTALSMTTGMSGTELASHAANAARIGGLMAMHTDSKRQAAAEEANELNDQARTNLGNSVDLWKKTRGDDAASRKSAARAAIANSFKAIRQDLKTGAANEAIGVQGVDEMKMKHTVGKKVSVGPKTEAEASKEAAREAAGKGTKVSVFGRTGGLDGHDVLDEAADKASRRTVGGTIAQGIQGFGSGLSNAGDIFAGKATTADSAIKKGELAKAAAITASGTAKQAAAMAGHTVTGGITTGGLGGAVTRGVIEHSGSAVSVLGSGVEELGKKIGGSAEDQRSRQRNLTSGALKESLKGKHINWRGREQEDELSIGEKAGKASRDWLVKKQNRLFPEEKPSTS